MNIKSIKNRANELLLQCKPQFIRILLIVTLLNIIPTVVGEIGFVGSFLTLVLTLVLLTVSHGSIVSSLKIVRNNSQALNDDDAWVGLKRFQELFPTYVLDWVISFAVAFIGIIVLTFIVLGSVYASSNPYDILSAFIPVLGFVIILVIVLVIVVYYINLCLFAVPYLLEQYGIQTTRAIKESFAFMKGHKMDLFQLDLSYIGWLLLQSLIVGAFSMVLASLPFLGALIGGILSAFFAVYTYLPQYQLSKAIFFEEIAFTRYGGQCTQENTVDEVGEETIENEETLSENKGE